jgi:hypothetical protein
MVQFLTVMDPPLSIPPPPPAPKLRSKPSWTEHELPLMVELVIVSEPPDSFNTPPPEPFGISPLEPVK